MTTANLETTERNRVTADAMYAAVKNGDLPTFFSFVSPDVVVEEPHFLPYGGNYNGIDGLQQLFGTLASKFDLAGLEFEQIVVDGDYVCAIVQVPVVGSSGVMKFIERALMRDGKIVSLRIYVYDGGGLTVAS